MRIAAILLAALCALVGVPAAAATLHTMPPVTACVHVTVVTQTATGTEADLPVRLCGIARRWGPWTCTAPGQFGAGMKLVCTRP